MPGMCGKLAFTCASVHETGLLSAGSHPCRIPILLTALAASIHLASPETAK